MATVTLIGIDIGKHHFHLVAHDTKGHVLLKRQFGRHVLIDFLARHSACRIVMEACCGAHWLARKLAGFGHTVQLIAPQYVRPFVQGNKNDFLDAQAICEAASRPTMRYVAAKSPEQQALAALHRLREARIGERVQTGNQIHALLLEFGIALPQGAQGLQQARLLLREREVALPPIAWRVLEAQLSHHDQLQQQIDDWDCQITVLAKQDDVARRLMTVPGIGPITASQLAADAGQAKGYHCARDFAASLGLVPRQHSTGGKSTLLGISKRGDKALRRLLVQCAHVIMMSARRWHSAMAEWTAKLMLRRHGNVVACAVANKLARVVWAILAHGGEYRPYPETGK
ncbi:IS110 family transposase [Chromobacterium sp. ATCC 53434]|uniref:IS110 family transposase n=1 Tax=Chromobacterium sp. (strain ATCC 53434 / SC 14030) TaxID=2059672 RepID=UPI000C786685|nr:IS110 family transposase [Chromobacterium sp. ATCC 53434]AUH50775.1 IS110 family transposase [Chromobacterium sp. ATCC 53434]